MKTSILTFLLCALFLCSGYQPVHAQARIPYADQKHDVFHVTPNPGNGLYQLVYKGVAGGQVQIAVSDATGKYVYLKSVREFSGEIRENVDISNSPRGIYIFEIETEKSRDVKRVIYQ